ncbi:ADP-ribose pyrophosphatase YjhB (NUDIX family) [Hyphomicrobiales bacterium]|nr:ADP-ribose pyrophosphatase YjhB (NUDIX family) [Hyphomicrobiales bacterium]CAH1670404.1 ADP-ribose pyrophosphatase YjhB (NUDIX family) [Hyphomicrobiales bacterium]
MRLIYYVMHLYWRFTRGLTLGVRAVVLDPDNRVFLVRHSYIKGWHLPGGGVEPGETLVEALRRELEEEGNILMIGRPALHGIFLNGRAPNRDHVAIYLVRRFRQSAPRQADAEILETGFFPLDSLPEGTTEGTRARILEIKAGLPAAALW